MKRYGNLFDKTFSEESLYNAYLSASKGKKKTGSYLKFSSNLGYELIKLREEILSGEYKLRPYRRLQIKTPKVRDILAPHFRDVIVQHAIYTTIYPIFNKTFIHTSFACRKGKGTHAASDYAYFSMKESPKDSYTLHLDVKKYFPSINIKILIELLEKKIKDKRLLEIMKLFCTTLETKIGIPLGNLLSQLYALIYLNPVDHYIKRFLKVKRYVRYVDDMVLIGITKQQAKTYKKVIQNFLYKNLFLSLSKWSLKHIKRGINFVGYRTWVTHRLIRKYSLHKIKSAINKNKDHIVWSIISHAKRSSSIYKIKSFLLTNKEMTTRLSISFQRKLNLCSL